MQLPDVRVLAGQVEAGDRVHIAKAITLVESTLDAHRALASELLHELLPRTGKSKRVAITGVPGVGKSTFIDALGMHLLSAGHRVAVLAVDPSSVRTGGSILGDRTRMMNLARDDRAFIRPSPTAGTLGGVARATRESMIIMEAAGFDVVLVETVGVGQSEVTVAGMVDCFLFLTLARTGDGLQGIKKGVLELADVVAVNKAEEPHAEMAKSAALELTAALQLVYPPSAIWKPPVLTCSALEHSGIEAVWAEVLRHEEVMRKAGLFEQRRKEQQVEWMWTMVHEGLLARLHADPDVQNEVRTVSDAVSNGTLTASAAASRILSAFGAKSA
ncbi:MAG: methylmalonyl Co-A mutase-associated GTPase MeaB [Polyangiaceae bacterium]